MKHFYAQTSPRGFANEFTVIAFDSQKARDEYIETTDGAEALTRNEARQQIRYNGDEITSAYNNSLNCYIDGSDNAYAIGEARCNIAHAIETESLPAGASATPVVL